MAAQSQFRLIWIILLVIIAMVIVGCMESQSERVLRSIAYEESSIDTTTYPLLINDSAAIIFPFGHMTADKGLKLYYDTVHYSPESFRLDDSIRKKLSAH